MKKIITFILGALVAVTLLAASQADGQSDITFERQPAWLVTVDGETVGVADNLGDARTVAAETKRAMPASHVAYTREILFVANLAVPPPATPTAEPDPTVTVMATPTATTLPTVKPTATPEPTTEPTATALPTSTALPMVTPPPTATPDGELVWGYDTTPLLDGWVKPELYETYVDPAYGSLVTRVSSAEGTRFDRNTYSRRQAENSVGDMFMTYHGTAAYHVYERSTGGLVRALPIHPDAEPQWHPTNPNAIRYLEGPNSYVGDLMLFEIDVRSGAVSVIADLTDEIRAVLPTADYMKDRAEGSASADGNRYAWLVYDAAEQIIGIASYDVSTNSVLGILPASELPDAGVLDAISMAPTGQYVVTQHYDGTYVYDADMTNQRLIFAGGEHSDIALDADGNDVYVYIDFTAGPTGGWLIAVDLATLTPIQIFDLYDGANTSIHISGKGYNKPGWVIASTYNCHAGFAWSCFKVMAVELAPGGRVLNLAHTYNCGSNYWTETHAVVNRDFTRVYFNSDGGSCGIDAEVYLIEVPSFS